MIFLIPKSWSNIYFSVHFQQDYLLFFRIDQKGMLSAVKRFPAVQGKAVAVAQFRTPLLEELVLLRGSLMMTFTAAVNMVVMQVRTWYLFSQATRLVHCHLEVIKTNCHTLYLGFLGDQWPKAKRMCCQNVFFSQNVNRASEQWKKKNWNTGRERLIRTRLIRSSTLFEVTVKYLSIIVLIFHV